MKKTPDLSAVKLLGSMCSGQDRIAAEQADNALYQQIIIPLCDDFTSRSTRLSLLILAELIQQAASDTDTESRHALDKEGLHSADQLLARLNRIQKNTALSTKDQQQIRKICILSRVTIGADISITSIMIQRLHQHFPDAAITLIGPDHLVQLFDYPFLHHCLFKFNRTHANVSRISRWLDLQQLISHERGQLTDREFLLIDPDTRISQLGLLPLAPEYSTRILPSRIDQPGSYSLSKITNIWLNSVLQIKAYVYPTLALKHSTTPVKNSRFTIVINFGVGQNRKKRISLQFEQELIATLIHQNNTRIILDSGKGQEETAQAKAIENFIREQKSPDTFPHSFSRIQTSINTLARQIRKAHLFIGYDSCSGHIATACQTPAVICFKGAPNSRFYDRWLPENQAKTAYCLKVPQKQLTDAERSLLIHQIIDIASSHYQTFQPA